MTKTLNDFGNVEREIIFHMYVIFKLMKYFIIIDKLFSKQTTIRCKTVCHIKNSIFYLTLISVWKALDNKKNR